MGYVLYDSPNVNEIAENLIANMGKTQNKTNIDQVQTLFKNNPKLLQNIPDDFLIKRGHPELLLFKKDQAKAFVKKNISSKPKVSAKPSSGKDLQSKPSHKKEIISANSESIKVSTPVAVTSELKSSTPSVVQAEKKEDVKIASFSVPTMTLVMNTKGESIPRNPLVKKGKKHVVDPKPAPKQKPLNSSGKKNGEVSSISLKEFQESIDFEAIPEKSLRSVLEDLSNPQKTFNTADIKKIFESFGATFTSDSGGSHGTLKFKNFTPLTLIELHGSGRDFYGPRSMAKFRSVFLEWFGKTIEEKKD
ncbi:hypothetical protein [Candidatus Bealeia paramacronuclearis]